LAPIEEVRITAAVIIYVFTLIVKSNSRNFIVHYYPGLMQHDLIERALHLNVMARSLFVDDTPPAISSHHYHSQNQRFSLLHLAVDMNSCHLCFHFAHFHKAQKSQESLSATLRQVQPGQLSDPDAWMFFFAPIFHLEQFGMPTLAPQA